MKPGRLMSCIQGAGRVVMLMSGGGVLVAGLFLLETVPLTAVLIIVSAMGWVLISAAALCAEYEPCTIRDIKRQGEEDTSTKGAM